MLKHFDFQQLIKNLDRDLHYALRVEGKMDLDSISNYDEVKNAIVEKVPILIQLRWCHANDIAIVQIACCFRFCLSCILIAVCVATLFYLFF